MDTLPDEVLAGLLWLVAEYAPVLRGVCRAWRYVVAGWGVRPVPLTIRALAERDHADLLGWLRELVGPYPDACARLLPNLRSAHWPGGAHEALCGAARGGHLTLVGIAMRVWGAG